MRDPGSRHAAVWLWVAAQNRRAPAAPAVKRLVSSMSACRRPWAPRVNDRRVDEATGERKRVSSAILRPWCRKAPKISEVLPLLYLPAEVNSSNRPRYAASSFALIRAGNHHNYDVLRDVSKRSTPSVVVPRREIRRGTLLRVGVVADEGEWHIHLHSVITWTPKSAATCSSVTPRPRFLATRTASSRNSSGCGFGTTTSFPPAPQGKPVQISPDRLSDLSVIEVSGF
jgi:hypothetical protein